MNQRQQFERLQIEYAVSRGKPPPFVRHEAEAKLALVLRRLVWPAILVAWGIAMIAIDPVGYGPILFLLAVVGATAVIVLAFGRRHYRWR